MQLVAIKIIKAILFQRLYLQNIKKNTHGNRATTQPTEYRNK